MRDLQQAVRWLRAEGPRYGVDGAHIGAFGYSAGAHLAALLATVGAPQRDDPALYAAASPVVHVSSDDPPMFLYHGGRDSQVDVSQARELKRALDAAGVRAELHVLPLLGHVATFLLAYGTEDAAIDFLQEALRDADGPPKM